MNKIIRATFELDGQLVSLEKKLTGGFKAYLNNDSDTVYITNSADEVICEISADCAQNTGYLKVN